MGWADRHFSLDAASPQGISVEKLKIQRDSVRGTGGKSILNKFQEISEGNLCWCYGGKTVELDEKVLEGFAYFGVRLV